MEINRTIIIALCVSSLACSPPATPIVRFETWTCTIPERLDGPVDAELPADATVESVLVAKGDRKQIAIAWSRRFEERAQVSDKDGSIPESHPPITSKPVSIIPENLKLHPLLAPLHNKPRQPSEGRYLGTCVIGPSGIESRRFVPRIGIDSGFAGHLMGDLAFGNGRFYLGLLLWSLNPLKSRMNGVAIVEFDVAAIGEPKIVLPGVSPALSNPYGSRLNIIPHDDSFDLLWLERYNLPNDLPDSGISRLRINRNRTSGVDPGITQVIYDFGWKRARSIEVAQFVEGPNNKCALLFRRAKGGLEVFCDAPVSDLYHIPDLLEVEPKHVKHVAGCRTFGEVAAEMLGDQSMVVVWINSDSRDLMNPGIMPSSLRVAYMKGDHWSDQNILARGIGWNSTSLAAAQVLVEGEMGVLVLWRDASGSMSYLIGIPPNRWSLPRTTSLKIGDRNWLVSDDQVLYLISRTRGNIYYSRLTLSKITSQPNKP